MNFKFEELVVYQRSVGFADRIYSLSRKFSKDEMFGLTSQLRRAAVSISLNIAEGTSRTKKDFSRFLDISRGSVFECLTVLKIALGQNYVTEVEFKDIESELVEISKMLSGLKKSLNKN